MKTIHLYGHLAEKYGKRHKLAVKDAAEAVVALSCLYEKEGFRNDFLDVSDYHVFYGTKKNPIELDEENFLFEYDSKNIHFIPIVQGGNRQRRSGLGKIIASIAIFAVSFAIPGSGPLATAAVNTLRSVSASMFFTGVGMLLSPQIKPNDSGVEDQSYLFGNIDGTVGRGNPVPLIYGECLATGYAISQDIDTSYIIPPTNNYTVPGFVDGQLPWVGSYYDVIGAGGGKSGGGGGGTESPNTLTTVARARVLDLYSEGPIEGFSDTDPAKAIYMQGVPLRGADDKFNFEGVSFTFRPGLPDQDFIPGFESASTPRADISEQPVLTSNAAGVVFGGNKNASGPDAVKVTIAISELFSLDSQTGNLTGTNLSYSIERSFNGGAYQQVVQENLIGEKTNSRYERDYRIELPEGTGNWNIRVRKLTADSATQTLRNTMSLARVVELRDAKLSYRHSAVVGTEFDAKQFGANIPSRQAKIKGLKIWVPKNYNPITRQYATSGEGTSNGTWDGTFKLAWTDNPAWILYDLMINDRYGLGQEYWKVANSMEFANGPTNAIPDKWSLYSIAQRCDELVFTGNGAEQEPRHRVGIQITSRQEAYQLLQSIAAVFQGMLYYSDGKVYTVADRPQADEFFLNQTDVLQGVFNRQTVSRKALFSTALVYWNDPNNLDRREVEVVDDPELYVQLGDKPTDIQLFGCRSKIQARRHGRWFLRTQQTQSQVISCVANMKAAVLFPGMVGRIFDPHYAGVRYSGRIVASVPNPVVPLDNTRRLITIDTPNLTVPIGTQMYTELLGNFAIYTVESFATDSTATYLGVVGGGANGILAGADYGINLASASGERVRIVSIKQEEDGFTVDMVPHDANKYMYVDEFVDLPDEKTSILRDRKPLTPLSIVAEDYYIRKQGADPIPCLSVTYRPDPQDSASIVKYQVEITQNNNPYRLAYEGTDNVITIENLQFDFNATTRLRVRTIDVLGRFSEWLESSGIVLDGIDGISTLSPPQGITAVSGINSIILRWTKPTNADYKHVEVWVTTPAVGATETLVAEVEPNTFNYTAELDGTYSFRLRTVLHTQTKNITTQQLENRRSAFSSVVTGTRRRAESKDISATLPDIDPLNWGKFVDIETETKNARRGFANLTQSVENARDVAISTSATELAQVQSAGPNLLLNPQFVSDLTHWNQSPVSTLERVQSGDFWFARPISGAPTDVFYSSNLISVEPNTTYQARCRARANTNSNVRVGILFYSDAAGTAFITGSTQLIASVNGSTVNNNWTVYSRVSTGGSPNPITTPANALSARVFFDNNLSTKGLDWGVTDITFNKGNRVTNPQNIVSTADTTARITTLNTALTSEIGAVATKATNLTAQMSRQSPNIHLNSLFERSPFRQRSFVLPSGATQLITEPDPTRLGQTGFSINFIDNAVGPSISRQGTAGQHRMRIQWTGAINSSQLVMNIGQDSGQVVRRVIPNQRYAFGIRVTGSSGNGSHLAPSIWWVDANGGLFFDANSAISGVPTFNIAGGSAWISATSPSNAVGVRLFITAFKTSVGDTGPGWLEFDLPFFGPIPADATAAPTWVPGEDSTSTATFDTLASVAVTATEAGAYSKDSIVAALKSPLLAGGSWADLAARFNNEVILTVNVGPQAGTTRSAAFMANELSSHINLTLGELKLGGTAVGANITNQAAALTEIQQQSATAFQVLSATALGGVNATVSQKQQAFTNFETARTNIETVLNAVFKGTGATVSTKAQAVADAANRSAAAWVTTVTAGGSTATVRLTAADSNGTQYSNITLKADAIDITSFKTTNITADTINLNNSGTDLPVLTVSGGFAKFSNPTIVDVGTRRTIIGGNLPLWVGANTITPATASIANSSIAIGTDGKLYRDGVEVYTNATIDSKIAAASGSNFQLTVSTNTITTFVNPGVVNANSNQVTTTVTGAVGSVQYFWERVATDGALAETHSALSPFLSNTQFRRNGTFTSGSNGASTWRITANDTANGRTASQVVTVIFESI